MAYVPKIIHQSGPDDRSKWSETWHHCQKTVLDHFPPSEGYVHMYWTDDMNRMLVEDFYPQHLKMYNGYPHWVCQADFARFMYLHKYGGLYLDLDYWVDRPFFDQIDIPKPCIVESPYGCYQGCHEWLQNSLMSSPPRHPVWLEVMNFARSCPIDQNPIQVTGPGMLSNAIQDIGFDNVIEVLPADKFNPRAEGEEVTNEGVVQAKFGNVGNVYCRHFLSGTWWRPDAEEEV